MSRYPQTEEARADRPYARRHGVDGGFLRRSEDEDPQMGAVLGTLGCSVLGCRSTAALMPVYQSDFYGFIRLALCSKHLETVNSEGLVKTFRQIRENPSDRALAGLPPLGPS